MRRTPHLSTHPGKHVRLKLRDGTAVDGKYVEHTKNMFIVLDVEGEIRRFHAKTIDKFIVVKTTLPKDSHE